MGIKMFNDLNNTVQMSAKDYDELVEELNYLRFFYNECDFGPAHDDCVEIIKRKYEREGFKVPEGYSNE